MSQTKSNMEKMLLGEIYWANDPEILKARDKAYDICMEYNKTNSSENEKRTEIIKKLFKKTGKDFCLVPKINVDYGFNITIGDNFYSNYNLVILDEAEVIFGNNIFIGPNCSFYTACHPIDYKQRNACYEYSKKIIVGNNVWFGGNVVVCPGVTIGDGSVIGAGSVVTRDIPPNVVAYGNPCKAIRQITEKDKINIEGIEIK